MSIRPFFTFSLPDTFPHRLDAWNRSRFLRDLLFSCLDPLRSQFSCLSPTTVPPPRYVLALLSYPSSRDSMYSKPRWLDNTRPEALFATITTF
jgi:hypothetical protein